MREHATSSERSAGTSHPRREYVYHIAGSICMVQSFFLKEIEPTKVKIQPWLSGEVSYTYLHLYTA